MIAGQPGHRAAYGAAAVAALLVACQTLRLIFFPMDTGSAWPVGLMTAQQQQQRAQWILADAGTPAEFQAARDAAAGAFRHSPIQAGALAVVAAVDQQRGAARTADRLVADGAAISRRDRLLNLLILGRSARSHDVAAMALDADVALRTNVEAREEIWPALFEEAANPAFAQALARRLASSPPWRLRFVQALGNDPAYERGAFQLLMALRRIGSPANVEESASYFTTGGRALPARELRRRWLMLDPALDRRSINALVYDGGFDGLGGSPPFNWSMASEDGLEADIAEGRLTVRLTAERSLRVAQQLLVLPTGSHKLRIAGAAIDGTDAARAVITLSCGSRPLLNHELILILHPRVVALPFDVPPDCDGIWLGIDAQRRLGEPSLAFMIDGVRID